MGGQPRGLTTTRGVSLDVQIIFRREGEPAEGQQATKGFFVVFVMVTGAADARIAVVHEASPGAAARHAAVAFSDPVAVAVVVGGSGSGGSSYRITHDGIRTSWSSSSYSTNVVLRLLVRGGSFPLTLS